MLREPIRGETEALGEEEEWLSPERRDPCKGSLGEQKPGVVAPGRSCDSRGTGHSHCQSPAQKQEGDPGEPLPFIYLIYFY